MESKLRLEVVLINGALAILRLQPETSFSCCLRCRWKVVGNSAIFFKFFFCQSGCDYFFRNTATFQQLFWGFAFHAFLSISPLQMPAAPGLKGESRLDHKGKQQTSKQMTKKQTNNQTALWSDLDALGDIRPCHLSYVISKPVSAAGAEWEQKRGLR